ncbi:hypothetical protein [Aquimarina aggregata]|uniref:hypothetical protein n=1 Tax=Aquimarina aggregata TaxID=1642818 RepID=UPI0024915D01|nr:hypothetical protein [Aquimarina aggregata]
MKKLSKLVLFLALLQFYGCTEEKTPFLNCVTPNFKSKNIDVKTELKRFETTLINQKIITDNSPESYRRLFALIQSHNPYEFIDSEKHKTELKAMEFDYIAKELTLYSAHSECHTIFDKDFEESIRTVTNSEISKENITEDILESGEIVKIKYNAYDKIPIKHFKKIDNQFYILFKTYEYGSLRNEIYH